MLDTLLQQFQNLPLIIKLRLELIPAVLCFVLACAVLCLIFRPKAQKRKARRRIHDNTSFHIHKAATSIEITENCPPIPKEAFK
jgi:hypothetical protein